MSGRRREQMQKEKDESWSVVVEVTLVSRKRRDLG